MTEALTSLLPGVTLAFVMGLRHGLAPDHLAAIDGLTVRAAAARSRAAPWMGASFAGGHAVAVMLFVLAAAATSAWVAPYEAVVHWIELAPPVFLFVLAALNARQLLRKPGAVTTGRSARWLPARPGAWSAFFVGMLFAVGFESALQAVAWGYAGAALGSVGPALAVAGAFTFGMAVTDGIDGWLAARISRTGTPERAARFRRRLGWPIVGLCIMSGTAMLLERACAACAVDEGFSMALGAAILAATVAAYAGALYAQKRDDQRLPANG